MDAERLSLPRRVAMLAWRWHVAAVRSRLVRPVDGRQAHATGRRVIRVLLVGSGPVVGWGVSSHDLALPGAIARSLAADTGRGAIVDVVPHPSAGVKRLRRLVDDAEFERYDAVVLSGAVADALRLAEPRSWEQQLRRLLLHVRPGGTRSVVWLGAQPIRSIRSYDSEAGGIADVRARRLNAIARELCHATGALYIELADPVGPGRRRHRAPGDYLFWARRIVDTLGPAVQERDSDRTVRTDDGADRVEAIHRLRLNSRDGDPRLDDIVCTAKRTLGTEIAMFTVLDDRNEWPLVSTGSAFEQIPIEQSVCIHTIRSADGMVVPDAAHDERFSGSALVTGPAGLRYYAGYPVEAPDGTRIGALCVFGRSPRESADGEADLDVLRELALLTQRELWRWAPPTE
ncbi:hypothetical protein [Leifsonia sp. LS-T14]|uniref:hypothetical protein n=1 Tax=unclassified Leifsonia TaxID=2663824 RepID=UPI0035A5F0D0